jgi:hypothetical protein
MQPRKSKPTTPNWAIELRSLLGAKTRDPVGEDWMTCSEFAAHLGVAVKTAQTALKRGLDQGLLERFRGTAVFGGIVRIQTWYRPIKKNRK